MSVPPNYGATGQWRKKISSAHIQGGIMYVDSTLLGFCMTSCTRLIVSSTAAFTVQVEFPGGAYEDHPDGTISGGANDIKIIRGRWNSIKVTTTGDVTVAADFTLGAF